MMARIRHRGPHATRSLDWPFGQARLWLGHHRLSILDPSPANSQPISDGRFFLAFNGEIYNYKLLRNQLREEGVRFETQGDTEVLFQWLLRYGTAGLAALDGMFAFVLVDLQQQTVLMARDRFGIKPLFYAATPQAWIACSEIKGILASGLVSRDLRPDQIDQYLRFRHAEKPNTLFQDISELPEGCYLTWSETGETDLQSFVPSVRVPENKIPSPERVEQLLLASVDRQLQADVPVGLFLSGGVDSTLLLAMSRELSSQPLPAFVMSLEGEQGAYGSDDWLFARKAAKQYGADLTEISITRRILDDLDRYAAVLGQPIADGGGLLTFLLSEAATREVGVVLSGAGADEWFGGYHRHLAFGRYLRHRPWLQLARPLISGLARHLPDGPALPFRKEIRLIRKFATSLEASAEGTFHQFRSLAFDKKAPSLPWPEEAGSGLDGALWQDRHHYLISDVLALSDQASMAHGLELRVPYLSNDIAGEIGAVPGEILLRHGRKWVLNSLLEQRGGQIYTRRKKEGFGLPLGPWLRDQAGMALLQEALPAGHSLFAWVREEEVREMIRLHHSGQRDLGAELFALLLLFRWYDQMMAE